MKKKVWALLLVFAVLVTTVNIPAMAGAEEEQDAFGVIIKVKNDVNGSDTTEEPDEIQTVQISAQNQGNKDAVLRIYLLREDKETADTEVEILNLCEKEQITDETVQTEMAETLKSALTLADGTNTSLDAEWVEKKDDSENVTARYLEAMLPAGAAAAFDMQLMYRTDEENYTKKTIVQAKAFVDEQDVTEASNEEDEDNETEVKWEAVKKDDKSEDAGENEETEGSAAKVGTTAGKSKAENSVSLMSSATTSRSVNLNENYIYLDSTGMTQADWNNQNIYLTTSSWSGKFNAATGIDQSTGYIYWDATDWSMGIGEVYLAITNDWSAINGNDYYRANIVGTSADAVKGKVFSWDGKSTTTIENHIVYELQEGAAFEPNDHTWFAGETMWFKNNSGENLSAVTAIFYEKDDNGTLQKVTTITMQDRGDGEFSTSIPSDECSYVQFVDPSNNDPILGDTYSNFYGQGEGEEGVENFIFNTSSKYCYLYNGTAENSEWGFRSDSMTVYFDASLSELSYAGTIANGDIGMPNSSNRLVCHAFDGAIFQDVVMTALEMPDGRSVYSASLNEKYQNVIFYTGDNWPADDSQLRTGTLTIDWSCDNPCFYADTSDDIAYRGSGKTRGGYWGELYSVRDAEEGKSTDVVDISTDTFTKAADTMYINSIFYDYYTDYELNGNNRDSYGYANTVSQQNWVTFRQFNQALSDYYEDNAARIPIYTGHFQPNWSNWGIRFSDIADTLGLYGYDKTNQSGFMSTNNSTMDLDGNGGTNEMYASAAQGLVGDKLEEGTLTIRDGLAAEPHFDADFLLGKNSKNTKLAEIYNNVAFPFTKKDIHGDGVEYWTFDSAETTLAMKQDPNTQQYYLKNVGNQDWSKNVNSSSKTDGVSTTYGFFPFNETSAVTSAKNYNYGFGTKIEFNFRLTDDGMVLNKDGQKVPITFEFSGDDDVWVFVDGNLALDVGGSHGRVTGSIDFSGNSTTKTSTVSNVKASMGSDTAGSNKENTFEITGSNTTEHTLTMYYMERGMWESNMKITFNFPDENLFEVEKQVDTADVNTEIFPEDLFTSSDSFGFNIKNAVTHWGAKEVSGEEIPSVEFNSTFRDNTVEPSVTDNIFRHESEKAGHTDVVYWKAFYSDNEDGDFKEERWGIIRPEEGASVDITKQEYLSFDFYFDNERIPSLNNMWICLEDQNGKTCDVKLSSQNTYGSANLPSRQWKTIRVYLDKIPGIDQIDKGNIAKVKLAFRYERDIYLDNIAFEPETTMDVMTGFTVQQADIPDYGSVQANAETGGTASLVNPAGAVYTVTNENGGKTTYGRIGTSGEFSLGDGDTASFSNQFRIGSYIYLEETGVNKDAFTTSWSLYDNGIPVTSYGTGDTVINPSQQGSLVSQAGYALEDGRTEKKDNNSQAANYTQEKDTEEPSIVFRSYTNPDSRANATKLKAVVVNKVNTGSISVTKGKADNSPELGDVEYTFKITFTNIAGSSLESTPIIHEVKVKAGETKTITGIPIGTDYVIEEVTPTDGSRLESIVLPEGNEYVEIVNNTVHGLVMKSTSEDTATFVFNNTKRPLLDIRVEKMWQDVTGQDMSGSIDSSIYIQLQRKYTENGTEKPFEPVEINGKSYIQIQKGYEGWKYDFIGLEKYQDNDCQIPYTYRVVEGTINDSGDFQPIDDGGIIVVDGQEYVVDYQCRENGVQQENPTDDITGNTDTTQSQTFTETIVNKMNPKTNLKIVKVDASDINKKLGGVEFTLEKGTADSTAGNFNVDTAFGTNGSTAMVTGDGEENTVLGEVQINDLEEGIYRITETKAHAGYSLLKDPLYLKIDRKNGCTIQEGSSAPQNINVDSETNTITITVSNRLLFELPSTGGYLRAYMIVGGLALIGAALFIYRLQKRRKGARAPRR